MRLQFSEPPCWVAATGERSRDVVDASVTLGDTSAGAAGGTSAADTDSRSDIDQLGDIFSSMKSFSNGAINPVRI